MAVIDLGVDIMSNTQGMRDIFVFGASGHAKVVIDIIERQGLYRIAFLVDDNIELKGREVYGYKVIGRRTELKKCTIREGLVAIGGNRVRQSVAGWLTENGYNLVSVIHPSAEIGRGVVIGRGSVVMAGVVVNSDAVIGDNVIVNTKASIDHDCFIGHAAHIAPGAVLCGKVQIGSGTFVCAGATLIPNIIVGCNVVVGAGSTVIKDIPNNLTVIGNPARLLVR